MSALSISSISRDGLLVGVKGLPQHAPLTMYWLMSPTLGSPSCEIAQARHRVVLVQPLLRLGGRP